MPPEKIDHRNLEMGQYVFVSHTLVSSSRHIDQILSRVHYKSMACTLFLLYHVEYV